MSWRRKCLAANTRSGPESRMASDGNIGLDFFLGFGRALRAEGLQLGSAEIQLFTRALAKAEVKSLCDIYWVGRFYLTASPEQIPIYDRVFQQSVQNMADALFPAAIALHPEESPPAISLSLIVSIELSEKSRLTS